MALSKEQERIWGSITESFEQPELGPFVPRTLRVSYPVESEADLLEAIAENIATGKLGQEEIDFMNEFFGIIHETENPRAIIAELPYRQLEDGSLELTLTFPARGGDYGKA